ncbi:MAG: hypothetical protein Q7T05_02805, partial [Dehalococcoidia bacterium]|nr:hypothetical protein [Dehalococcoidia bacterium]
MIRERDLTGLLEAKIEFREQACHAYSIDFSLGCQHRCVYCHFSDEQKLKYRKAARGYDGTSIPMDLSALLSQTEYPGEIYL